MRLWNPSWYAAVQGHSLPDMIYTVPHPHTACRMQDCKVLRNWCTGDRQIETQHKLLVIYTDESCTSNTYECGVDFVGVTRWVGCVDCQRHTVGKNRQQDEILKGRELWLRNTWTHGHTHMTTWTYMISEAQYHTSANCSRSITLVAAKSHQKHNVTVLTDSHSESTRVQLRHCTRFRCL